MKKVILLGLAASTFIFQACEQKSDLNNEYYLSDYNYPSDGKFNEIVENPFINTADENTSTFSIDADGASYANSRNYINQGALPPADAIRTEEFVNYFDYNYAEPQGNEAIGLDFDMCATPWNADSRLLRIGIKGKTIADNQIPNANYVFLVDVSGSMSGKLPLIQYGLEKMVDALDANDRVALVTYAGESKVVLGTTSCSHKNEIKRAIGKLKSGGSTNGEGGIKNAYALAEKNYINGGNNRIVLCTDGDFNVGVSSQDELVSLIETYRDKNIFITVVGVGNNYNDGTMEQLANKGNGTCEFVDSKEQAERVFAQKLSRMLTVAKDVKVQVIFNANVVKAYRLIGYENRLLDNEQFDNDSTDAGEIGMGQTITALYEVIPVAMAAKTESSFTLNFRYKMPEGVESKEINKSYTDNFNSFANASAETQFAAAVASWALLMRKSEYAGTTSYNSIVQWAQAGLANDADGARAEFIQLVRASEKLEQ
ncbi:DUF3520 domain-containing protein [bacterium]|nr:DUF3520 domain-containing protein [bacterium]